MGAKTMSRTPLEMTPDGLPAYQTDLFPTFLRGNLPPRILVVDDDTAIRELYAEALKRQGYKVDTAEDGDAGWAVLQAAHHNSDNYALLITDNNMPKLTGIELVRKLRAAQIGVPIILASGTAPLNTDRLHLAAVLEKPFSTDTLVQTVKSILLC
ncbi:MAG: response regulator [Akkermansiaceae bacterium]|nr:response regulator [Verrucomicrobiales bacterium]